MCPSDKHLDEVRRILRNPMLCENIRHWYQLQALCAQFLLYALMALFATAYRYYLTSMFVLLVRGERHRLLSPHSNCPEANPRALVL